MLGTCSGPENAAGRQTCICGLKFLALGKLGSKPSVWDRGGLADPSRLAHSLYRGAIQVQVYG